MKIKSTLKLMLYAKLALSGVIIGDQTYAQDCTANAGGNSIICGSATVLSGGVAGTIGAGEPAWTFISGPATPTIVSPNTLTTDVTGMVEDGDYIFQLSHPCGTGTATSQVTITAHPRPASFTAGPDITNVCATTGLTTLEGVIPAGFSGEWRTVNIFSLARFSTQVSTNAQFSSTTVAEPTFELINKENHEIDPAYYAILTITSLDGNCTYEDTAVVRFLPNPEIVIPDRSVCRVPSNTRTNISLPNTSPGFSTTYAGSAGTAASGTTVTLNVISQPAGASMTFDEIESRMISFTGMTVNGTYTYTVTVSNDCGSYTTPVATYNYTGTAPYHGSFEVASAPEQWMVYRFTNSGGEVHCADKVGSTTPETFYFTVHPDNPPTVVTTVTPVGILPPGGAPTVTVSGDGTYNRVATVTPPAGGWQVGTYKFNVTTANDDCSVTQSYYIHISDSERPDVEIENLGVCYPGTGAISATVSLPEIYKGVVNSSYFQDYDPHYNFSVVSRPAGSADPVYTSTNLRNITSTSTVISNLNMPGAYVFRITLANGSGGVGPFYNAEYACSDASFVDTFTVYVESPINANAGSDQVQTCVNSLSLLGNNPGEGTGLWTLLDAPAGSSPVVADPAAYNTTVSGVSTPGTYRLTWSITSEHGGCNSVDTVSFDIISISPDAPTVTVDQPGCSATVGTVTVTAPLGATFQYSIDGINYQSETTFSDVPVGSYEITTRIGTAGCISSTHTVAHVTSPVCGTVYNDANGLTDNTVNGTGTDAAATLYAILYDETRGAVNDVSEVNPDGTFTIGGVMGNEAVVYISTTAATVGQVTEPVVSLPAGWLHTGEVYCTVPGCSGSDLLPDGILSLGIITGTVTDANFGIQRAPTADEKSFLVDNSAFDGTLPGVFDVVSGYHSLPMSSDDLTGYTTGGSLSGTDPEDCPELSGCSEGAHFVIQSIKANTRLYYDFGTSASPDVQEIVPGVNGTIDNFDMAKMVIYGENGSGTDADALEFTYSIIDAAGAESAPVVYTITTSVPLSVELLSFEAVKQGHVASLQWITVSEKENSGFDIERSVDATNWSRLGFVRSQAGPGGNSDGQLSYGFVDQQPLSGLNFYRLKQTDLNGHYSYTLVRQLSFDDLTSITVYPNPAEKYITVSGLKGGEILKIYNVTGQFISEVKADSTETQISLQGLAAGTYTLGILSEDGVMVPVKIVKVR